MYTRRGKRSCVPALALMLLGAIFAVLLAAQTAAAQEARPAGAQDVGAAPQKGTASADPWLSYVKRNLSSEFTPESIQQARETAS